MVYNAMIHVGIVLTEIIVTRLMGPVSEDAVQVTMIVTYYAKQVITLIVI